MGKFFRFRIRISILALAIAGLGAQTRERKMQPTFYRSSPQDAIAPAQAPAPIRSATAGRIRAASAPAANGSLRAFVNSERNSRVSYRSVTVADLAWQVDLPEHFSAKTVLAGGAHVVVHGPDGWLLLDGSGRTLGNGRGGQGELTLDPANRVFYVPGPTGYIEARSLADGRREYFITAYAGEDYRRVLIERRDRRMLIVSNELSANPHAAIPPDTSAVELYDLGDRVEVSDAGRLKSAKRLDYMMATTADLMPAMHGDVIALAAKDSITVADFTLKLQRQLTGQFDPLFLSMDELSRLYLLARVASNIELWVVAPGGEQVVRVSLPQGFEPIAPPIVALDHSIFIISNQRILAMDPAGTVKWENVPPAPIAGAVVTPSGSLLAATGAELLAFSESGKPRSLFRATDDVLVTPPIVNEKGELLVAGKRRLYCLR